MEAYRRVYDLCHLQAAWQEPDQLRNPTLGNRVWATFTLLPSPEYQFPDLARSFVLLCSLAVLDPLVGHTMDALSPFIPARSFIPSKMW